MIQFFFLSPLALNVVCQSQEVGGESCIKQKATSGTYKCDSADQPHPSSIFPPISFNMSPYSFYQYDLFYSFSDSLI
jgi:hypothetical protein